MAVLDFFGFMNGIMLGFCKNDKVFKPVVQAIPIYMVHMFMVGYGSLKAFFHDGAVFGYPVLEGFRVARGQNPVVPLLDYLFRPVFPFIPDTLREFIADKKAAYRTEFSGLVAGQKLRVASSAFAKAVFLPYYVMFSIQSPFRGRFPPSTVRPFFEPEFYGSFDFHFFVSSFNNYTNFKECYVK